MLRRVLQYLGMALLVIAVAFNLWVGLWNHLDADMLFLPALAHDFPNWGGWVLPPAHYYFPDIPLYLIIHSFCRDVFGSLYLTILSYAVALGIGLWFLLKKVLSQKTERAWVVLAGLALVSSSALWPMGVVQGLFWPSFHAGAFIGTLWCYLLAVEWKGGHYWAWSLPLVFAFSAGDPLFVIFFGSSSSLFWLFNRPNKWGLKLALTLAILVAGYFCAKLLTPFTPLASSYSSLLDPYFWGIKLIRIWNDILLQAKLIPFLVLSLVFVPFLLREPIRLSGFRWLWFGSLICLFFSFFIGLFCSLATVRYFLGVFLFPLMAALVVGEKLKFLRYGLPLALWGLSLVGFVNAVGQPQPLVVAAQRLDAISPRLGLKTGLCDYWLAKPISLFSHTGLRLNALREEGVSRAWICNVKHFCLNPDGSTCAYNYIITDNLSEEGLKKYCGEPSETYEVELFPNKVSHIWVYQNSEGLTRAVLSQGELPEVLLRRGSLKR